MGDTGVRCAVLKRHVIGYEVLLSQAIPGDIQTGLSYDYDVIVTRSVEYLFISSGLYVSIYSMD